jgi:predicted SPOUT superfamily RNA methylase MTH1
MNATDLKRKYGYYPIGQQLKKIQASDAEASDYFGWSVAVSDTRIVVGAYGEDTTATDAGSAYIFDIDGNQIAKIQASDAEGGDNFGISVAVSDTRIVVGAYQEDTTATDAGSVYIFDIDGNQLAKIQASDAEAGDQFGRSVAVSDTRIVVGAPFENTTATYAGSVYIFDINGNQTAKIQASDAQVGDNFGRSVAVSDTRIVVGATYEDTTAVDAGSVYIFDINGNQLAKIQASDAQASDYFGYSVSVSDTRIVVGATYEDTTATNAGSAYIFDINGNQLAKIQASDVQAYDYFGMSVAVSDTRIVVGAPYEDTTANTAGSAYIFDIEGNQLAKIQASDAEGGDYFGYSVAVSDTRIVVGAYGENTTATDAGSAYIFSTGFSPFGDLCAYYDLGDPTVLDTNFSWSDYTT